MLFYILLDVLAVFLAYFFMSRNGPITTELLLTEFALTSHDSILSLQEKTQKQAVVLRLHCKFASRRDWDDKTGIKRAVGSVISGELAPSLADQM